MNKLYTFEEAKTKLNEDKSLKMKHVSWKEGKYLYINSSYRQGDGIKLIMHPFEGAEADVVWSDLNKTSGKANWIIF